MSDFAEQITKRLDQLQLSESQRAEALNSLRHAEHIADALIAIAQFGRWLAKHVNRSVGLAARQLRMRHSRRTTI